MQRPVTVARLMDTTLSGLAWRTYLAYLDDIIVYGQDWDQFLQRLEEVMKRLREANLKLNPLKCQLARHSATFLGHEVSQEGIRPDPGLTRAIADIQPPSNVSEVRTFVGMTSYYRRLI